MPSKHLTEYNTLRDNAVHFTSTLNTNQYTETRCGGVPSALYVTPVYDAIIVSTISRMLRAVAATVIVILSQGRSQEFCSGGASHWHRQISNFSDFAQRSFWCHWSISGLLQQDMTSNIFYQSPSINFKKDKKTFAFAVIIIKQLSTKQFSMNIKSSGKRSAV